MKETEETVINDQPNEKIKKLKKIKKKRGCRPVTY
jgi:hypothetical protein